ncbi:gap junction beta-3 protein [Pangasianodon hypophthalmus]|uniref:gap junction beta-3 protein n=1 Tax=Pangasianodon hypophthalmus TaxID=310915 RepID=UPI00147ADA11|nr:gap junction beta-3 protein [Pangasianodon hypophthalmus]XP_053094478.1 gap junction beta-3 protein [Pangasianodon hypophthalmus]
MAAIVTGLIPILRTAVDTTTTYKGRTLWFSFLCIRLVTLFVAEMPWFKLNSDFSCNVTKDSVCTRACFNQHFDKPVVMAWNYIFILLILSVLLMELFTTHIHSVFEKNLGERQESLGELKTASDPGNNIAGIMILDMHRRRNAVFFYLFSVMLRILVEFWFVYVLLYWNLSKLNQGVFVCKSYAIGCPDQECLVSGNAEKCMSIYALVSISVLVIISSCLFCVHLIGHYLCNCCTKESYSV